MHQINRTVDFNKLRQTRPPGAVRQKPTERANDHARHLQQPRCDYSGRSIHQRVNPKFDDILTRISNVHAQLCVFADGDSKFDNTARSNAHKRAL